ncbi:MAG: AlpA family phage regulatory protein [Pseudomonadota bacterium]
MNNIQLLTLQEVLEVTKRSRSSVYRDIKSGALPPPIHIGASARWLKAELDAAIGSHVAAREAALSLSTAEKGGRAN